MPLLLLAAAALASCADAGAPATDSDSNELAPVDAVEDKNDGTTSGSWQPAGDAEGQSVAFHAPGGELLFSIGCDRRGGLVFRRHGLVARANLGLMQLRTGGDVRRLAATTGPDDQPEVQARAPYNDQLIPALMRFDQPLEVRVEGLETLILPPSAEVGKLTETCQQGNRPAPGGPAAAPAPPPPSG
ncbi:hypothetical protein [Sphingomonas sp.]|uniref:hypothetical protein n=1 Tax=Sphingomonas sp. TaxID=28214 RepID=UPI0017BE8470|nr:hypothetical protein [Sphingomonas sp.]MBA3511934.1 hypothetical protein [Sphingomonas sp.]